MEIKRKNNKLNFEKVAQIKQLVRMGFTQTDVAKAFGVCVATVWNVKEGLIWKK